MLKCGYFLGAGEGNPKGKLSSVRLPLYTNDTIWNIEITLEEKQTF